ncbi:M15 family metallopeptidase [Aquirufa sp.]|jgi:D-alanyl-D-alanine dipeptidase|uniref:M15 family metallopeptidase n=1 Tax=Aquirufa sp. TaxID=2676249 RepID=UPI0037BF0654
MRLFWVLCLLSVRVFGQNPCSFEQEMQKQGLLEVRAHIPEVLVELKYATTDNFMGKDVYGCLKRAFLQPEVVTKLKRAQAHLSKAHPGYRLLIYDAARPLSKQWELWNTLTKYPPSERQKYVADPREHSIHNYGSAIDLTVADVSGKPLDMGTPYDFFGELAYPSREKELLASGKLSQRAYQNRLILRDAMVSAGFMRIEFEWWHFNAFSRSEAKRRYQVVR